MNPTVQDIILRSPPFSPYRLSGVEARYDLSNLSSLIYDGANRLQLVSDLSGNSAVNGLALNGATGNAASSPDSAAVSITGDIDVRANAAMANWAGSRSEWISKWGSNAAQLAWMFGSNQDGASAGRPFFAWTTDGATAIVQICSAGVPFANFAPGWVRVTLQVNNGGVYTLKFWTSTDGVTWAQLGNTINGASTTSIFDSTSSVQVGGRDSSNGIPTGIIYRAQIYNGIAGVLAFDANFTAVAKLATSFTESSVNAATVTINTSGDTGARICGARDLVQMTAAKQPILTLSVDGRNYATFDGSNDYLKSAPFNLSQPETVYFTGSQVTFTDGRTIFDGRLGNDMRMLQKVTSPNVTLYSGGGSDTCQVTQWTTGSRAVIVSVFNGSSSTNRCNRNSVATGNPGSSSGNGFTVGAYGDGTNSQSNITVSEVVVRSVADTDATQQSTVSFLAKKWGFSA